MPIAKRAHLPALLAALALLAAHPDPAGSRARALPSDENPATAPDERDAPRWSVANGFRIEGALAPPTVDGSVLALAFGPRGALILGREDKPALMFLDDDADGEFDRRIEILPALVGVRGLAVANGPGAKPALLLVAERADRPGEAGLHLAEDDDGDGIPDSRTLKNLFPFRAPLGEHGPRAVAVGPDGAWYLAVGDQPGPEQPTSPGGVVHRSADRGATWETHAVGFRNPCGLAWNGIGDLFTTDGDAEADLGLPSYRTARIARVAPGSDHGWRGPGREPAPDDAPGVSPPILDLGRAGPSALVSTRGARFPAEFADALLVADWSLGRVTLVTLPRARHDSEGRPAASYAPRARVLVQGRGAPVVDLAVGPDGALWFATGGRGAEGAVLRLVPDAPAPPAATPFPAVAREPALRVLADPDPRIDPLKLRVACDALARDRSGPPLQPDAVDRAIALLDHPDPELRRAAAALLARRAPLDDRETARRLLDRSTPAGAADALVAFLRSRPAPPAGRARDAIILHALEIRRRHPQSPDTLRLLETLVDLADQPQPAKSDADAEAPPEDSPALAKLRERLAAELAEAPPERAPRLLRALARLRAEPDALDLEILARLPAELDPRRQWELLLAWTDIPPATGQHPALPRLLEWIEWTAAGPETLGPNAFLRLDHAAARALDRLPPDNRARILATPLENPFAAGVLVRSLQPADKPDDRAALLEIARGLRQRQRERDREQTAQSPPDQPGPRADRLVEGLRAAVLDRLATVDHPEARAELRRAFAPDSPHIPLIARALAPRAEPADWPILARALDTPDPATLQPVLAALAKLPPPPDDLAPLALRNLLAVARRSPPGFRPALNFLANRWTGIPTARIPEDYPATLAFWESMRRQLHPEEPNPNPNPNPEADRAVRPAAAKPAPRAKAKADADPEIPRGRRLAERARCLDCHTIQGRGRPVGPDLTDVAQRLDPAALRLAIEQPSRHIPSEHRAVVLQLASGETVVGVPVRRTETTLALRLADGAPRAVPRSEIVAERASETSLMPADLLRDFTPDERAELLRWLANPRF